MSIPVSQGAAIKVRYHLLICLLKNSNLISSIQFLGSCAPSSTSTDLMLNSPSTDPNQNNPDFSITPRSPVTAFTIFDITFTTAYFVPQYPSVTIELTGQSVTGNTLPVYTVTLPKPTNGQFYSMSSLNLPSVGLGSLKKLKFLAFFTGSQGSGGQGPGGRVYAEVRLDADGCGSPIRVEAYTPLGCGNVYHKRDDGFSVSPMVLVRRTLEGKVFA